MARIYRGLPRKPRLRRASDEERRVVDSFAAMLGIKPEAVYVELYVLEVPGAAYKDAFDVPQSLSGVVESLEAAYSAGFYLGMIKREEFKPGLPLARRLSRLCGPQLRCHVVDSHGEKIFLYGREVWEEHVKSWGQGLSVVVNEAGEPLGWGVDKAKRGRRVLVPSVDLGWYLRRGG
jgi:60S ribosome subunit biogenesis protein NIP7